MSLQQRLDAFKTAFESGAPPHNAPRDVIVTMHRATDELRASGLAERALKVGDLSPAFELPNQDGVLVRSADLLGRGPLVISFFRGHW